MASARAQNVPKDILVGRDLPCYQIRVNEHSLADDEAAIACAIEPLEYSGSQPVTVDSHPVGRNALEV